MRQVTWFGLFLERQALQQCREWIRWLRQETEKSVRKPLESSSERCWQLRLGNAQGDGQEGKKDVRNTVEEELTGQKVLMILKWAHYRGVHQYLLHVIPVSDDAVFNGVFESKDPALALSFIPNIAVFLAHSHHHTLQYKREGRRTELTEGSIWRDSGTGESLKKDKDKKNVLFSPLETRLKEMGWGRCWWMGKWWERRWMISCGRVSLLCPKTISFSERIGLIHTRLPLTLLNTHTRLPINATVQCFFPGTQSLASMWTRTWWRGRPTMEGKTARGASSPAKPALHRPEPLSHTSAVVSSSHMVSVAEWTGGWSTWGIGEKRCSWPLLKTTLETIFSALGSDPIGN